MEEKICLKSMPLDKLESYLASIGQPKYRASQIFKWLSRGVLSFDERTERQAGERDIYKPRGDCLQAGFGRGRHDKISL